MREWAGAERWRRAADGGRPSGALGRWRGRAVALGYTPAQAVLPTGVRQGTWASYYEGYDIPVTLDVTAITASDLTSINSLSIERIEQNEDADEPPHEHGRL